jgi:hypothetical protein
MVGAYLSPVTVRVASCAWAALTVITAPMAKAARLVTDFEIKFATADVLTIVTPDQAHKMVWQP